MNVRVGNAGDFVAVVPMMRKHRSLCEEWDEPLYALRPDADERFRRWAGQAAEDPRSMLLVAEEGGRVVGFLVAVMEKDWPIYECDEYALVRELWVEPEFRRQGAATALIERAAGEYAALGIRQLRVRMPMANAGGRVMLERAGFRAGTMELVREVGRGKRRGRK